uniref:Farnesyl pyrophosphate synthase n=1 Tax=Phlebotomus papatasi TaxID=29031 RepID=A0A1B0CYT9_PHLPP
MIIKCVVDIFRRVLQYNVPHGKMYCGISVLPAYELMVPKGSLTEADIKLAIYLGWCVEMSITMLNLQIKAMLLIDDDIMDGSITRRGKPCWYKLEDVQLTAINDGLLIEESVYYILKKHFSHLQCYARLMEHFREMTFIGGVGQYLDSKSTQQDVLSFTMEQFKVTAQNKASYSGIYFPIAAAMHLAMCNDPEAFRQAEAICLEIGYFVQLQNDFLDCFGDPEITGKLGTDIQEGKCTWLAVMCLQRATMAQKMILKECYGNNDSESVKIVKQLYEELSLREICAKQEELSYNMICRKIRETSERHPIRVLQKLLGKTCQNTK